MNRYLALAMAVSLSACATKPINTSTARTSPPERVFAPELQVASESKVLLVIARDAGFIGSGCMTAVYLDGRIVSTIDNREKVEFYVDPGTHIIGTGPNPEGVALCGAFAERMRRETEIHAELGKPLKYRLAMSANGEISVMRTAF